jgi:hypothetical protein
MVEAFWGSAVYDFMMEKLETMPGRKLMRHFTKKEAEVCCGLVFSNGCQQSGQMSELGQIVSQGEHFWPVLFVIEEGRCLAWCQAQALNGSQPWPTHPNRVVKLKEATDRVVKSRKSKNRLGGAPAQDPGEGDGDWVYTPGPIIEEDLSGQNAWTVLS